jgi:hypothetical protein
MLGFRYRRRCWHVAWSLEEFDLSIRYLSNGQLLMVFGHMGGSGGIASMVSFCSCLGASRFCRGGGGGNPPKKAGVGNQLAARETSARQSRGLVGDMRPT